MHDVRTSMNGRERAAGDAAQCGVHHGREDGGGGRRVTVALQLAGEADLLHTRQ